MGYKPAYIWNGTSFDQIGNQAVASLDDYVLLNPVVGQTLTNTTLTSPTITSPQISSATINGATESGTIGGTRTHSGSITLSGTISGGTLASPSITSPVFTSPEETITISATAATGTIAFDCLSQGILYYTSNASANFTINFRGSSSQTLNGMLSTGQSFTATFLVTNGATAYYPNAFQIDGSAVTPKWAGGIAPSYGNANSIDSYTFTIIKTGSAAFTVLAGSARFA